MIRLLPAACAIHFLLALAHAQTAPKATSNAATLPVPLPDDDLQRQVLQHTLFLDNGSIRVGVSAQVGRIVWFSTSKSTDNLLWLNTASGLAETQLSEAWSNWGGDKLWPAPQAQWTQVMGSRWPPDPVLDGLPWKVVHHDRRSCLIESRPSPYWGVVMRRRITLDPDRPRLEIHNTIERVGASSWPVNSWPVTQTLRPDYLLLETTASRPERAAPWVWLSEPAADDGVVRRIDGAVSYQPPAEPATKIGTMGRWIAAVYPNVIFLQETRDEPDPAKQYADDASVQAYGAAAFVEMELLSPIVPLPEGEHLEQVVRWHLLERNTDGQGANQALQHIRRALADP